MSIEYDILTVSTAKNLVYYFATRNIVLEIVKMRRSSRMKREDLKSESYQIAILDIHTEIRGCMMRAQVRALEESHARSRSRPP